ncbi:hypothetical protein OIU84_029675 [Salix udensis]|uniref:Uncharacterized protein n=1 Tax=Salix udensis TaxID=889485 RepID=A0AAD6P7D6_9ROSI|nr:hypothetical protein OIU84_029675 [Salix udensis]
MDELACCLILRGSSFSCSLAAEFELFSSQSSCAGRACEYFIFWLSGVIFSVSVANWEGSRVRLSLFLLLPRSPCSCPLLAEVLSLPSLIFGMWGLTEAAWCWLAGFGGLSSVRGEGLRVWEFGQCSSAFPLFRLQLLLFTLVYWSGFEYFIFWLSGVIFSVSVANWEGSRVRLSLFLLLPRSPCSCPLLAEVLSLPSLIFGMWGLTEAAWCWGWMSWLVAWSCVGPPSPALWRLSLNFSLPSRLVQRVLACVGVWAAFFCFPPLSVAAVVVDPCVLVWVCE